MASLPLMDVFRSKFPESTDFSMFMLDQEDSDEKQSSLLRELLAQITSAKPWFEYISYLQHQKCGGKDQSKAKKVQLNNLLNKGMQTIDGDKHKHDKYYEKLQNAHFKSNRTTPVRLTRGCRAETAKDEDDEPIILQGYTSLDSRKDDNTVEISAPSKKKSARASRNTTSVKLDESVSEKTVQIKSLLKSKYIDDTMKNFDPLTFRKKTLKQNNSESADNKRKSPIMMSKNDCSNDFVHNNYENVKFTTSVTDANAINDRNDSHDQQLPKSTSLHGTKDTVPSKEIEESTIPLGSLLSDEYLDELMNGSEKNIKTATPSARNRHDARSSSKVKSPFSSNDTIEFATKNKRKNNPRNELNNSGKRMDEKSVVMPGVHNKVSMQNFDTDCDSSAKPSSRVFAQKPRLSPGLINLDENKFISYVVKKGNLRPVDDRLGKVGDFKEATSSFVETSHDSFKVSLNRKEYMKVGMLGKGGSSCVYRVLAPDGNFFAYKRVEIRNGEDGENLCESYINEIRLLQKLKGSPHIIELMDADIDKEQMYIAMVMEVGEIDLAKVLQEQSQQVKKCAENNSSVELSSLSPFFIRMVWQEMLEAVDYIHKNRIVHGDLKPANFVFVKGHLKLIDFGIAKAFSNDTTNIYRDSQIGTINYMAPEAICPFEAQSDMDSSDDSFDDDTIAFKSIDGKSKNKSCFGNGSKGKMKMGRASDIWSMGCILYQLLYGRPPFSALSTIQKLQAIPNPNFPIPYPNHIDIHGIDAVQACLQRNISSRANIRGDKGLLCMNFLQIFPSASSSRSLSPPSSTYNLSKENIQKIIEMVSASGSIAMNCFNVDKLHHQAIQILNGEDIVIPSHAKIIKPDDSVERDELAEDKVVAVSSASCVGPLPDDIENQKPFNANSSDCFTSTILNRKPMATIPLSLSEQIQSKLSGKLALKSITESSQVNAKYINRSTPNNKADDMQAALEKKLAQMRNFIRVEEMDSDEDDTGTGSDFNASTRNL